MTKFLSAMLIGGFAFAAFTAPSEAGCAKGAIVGGIVGHMVGHGAVGAAAGCAYGSHQSHKAKQQRDDERREAPDHDNQGSIAY